MAAIKGSHTKPELQIRKAMHAAGLRYRLHVRDLPGKPDLVFPKYRAVVFVNGCFWHHHNCDRNVSNDTRSETALLRAGWRVATVWECSLKGKTRLDPQHAMRALAEWIQSDRKTITIRGH